jgi:hypothetical protein
VEVKKYLALGGPLDGQWFVWEELNVQVPLDFGHGRPIEFTEYQKRTLTIDGHEIVVLMQRKCQHHGYDPVPAQFVSVQVCNGCGQDVCMWCRWQFGCRKKKE